MSQQLEYEQAMEREYERMKREEFAQVVRRVRQLGGIRPYRGGREFEEWQGLPPSVKRYRGMAADEVAFRIAEEFPWLRIERDSDLFEYLKGRKR